MSDAGYEVYNSINSWEDLENLIENAETEGLHLECKSPQGTQVNKDMKNQIARAVSGFSNTAGGIVIWGLSTTRHDHSKLDVITQIEPIGKCESFEKQVKAALSTVTSPSVLNCQTKVIKEKKTDERGVVLAYIPLTTSDPVMSNYDSVFYFRTSDGFIRAPYEIIKRLFSATNMPDLFPIFYEKLVKQNDDGSWTIPIFIENKSIALAEHVDVSVTVINPEVCEKITSTSFRDVSSVNPGKTIFMDDLDRGVHKGMPMGMGSFDFTMKVNKSAKRRLDLVFEVYANNMRARYVNYTFSLSKSKFSVKETDQGFLY